MAMQSYSGQRGGITIAAEELQPSAAKASKNVTLILTLSLWFMSLL
jgi:hypothetical protein